MTVKRTDRVGQSAGLVDNGDCPVTQTDHLAQSARLKTRRHQKKIGTGINLMGQILAELKTNRNPFGVMPGRVIELTMIFFFPNPEDQHLHLQGLTVMQYLEDHVHSLLMG